MYNRDVISMPDKWEYPWFAAWDLAFHMIPFARIDPDFAKEQLLLLLREWYMHPNGQIPGLRVRLRDVNPPVHAWACWRVYKMTGPRAGATGCSWRAPSRSCCSTSPGGSIARIPRDSNLFAGGFLGLDNIGVFDRSPAAAHRRATWSRPTAPPGWPSTAPPCCRWRWSWPSEDPAYEDVASKFFEHFVAIADAINTPGRHRPVGRGGRLLLRPAPRRRAQHPLRVRSLVGLIPLIAVEVLERRQYRPAARLQEADGVVPREPARTWRASIACMRAQDGRAAGAPPAGHSLAGAAGAGAALPAGRDRVPVALRRPLGVAGAPGPARTCSTWTAMSTGWTTCRVSRAPDCSAATPTGAGRSGSRSTISLLEALERYHHFYGDELKVECPAGSGRMLDLREVARRAGDAARPSIFLPDATAAGPATATIARFATDPHWRDLVLFHEYFHGDTGRGVGASHQTGWTALVLRCIEDLSRTRPAEPANSEATILAGRALVGSRS